MKILDTYTWPGNVRELQNIIERSYYLANPPIIKPADLPSYWQHNTNSNIKKWENIQYKKAKDQAIRKFERDYLLFQLNEHKWNISRTADFCGMDRRTLHRLIKKYNIKN